MVKGRKWDEEVETYLMKYVQEHDTLDIDDICRELNIGRKTLRWNVNRAAKRQGMRIDGITTSLFPRIRKAGELRAYADVERKIKTSTKKTDAPIIAPPEFKKKEEQKFMCRVRMGDNKMFLSCWALSKEKASVKVLDGHPAIEEVLEVRTWSEHRAATHVVGGKFSMGPNINSRLQSRKR